MEIGKSAITSSGFWGTLIAAVVALLGIFGVDVSADVAGLDDKISTAVNSIIILGAALTGLWGRLTADKKITSLF